MSTQGRTRVARWLACMLFAWPWLAAHAAEEVPLVTGKHWSESSDQLKKAYLLGIANVLQVEAAFQAGNPPSDAQSIVPRAGRGLRGHTLDSVREALDRWYAAHPDQLQRPVIETIWFEIVVPGINKPA